METTHDIFQNQLLHRYMALKDSPTLKVMEKDTGIQKTRLFRLLNGSELKLSEYRTISDRINRMSGRSKNLESLLVECEGELSIEALSQIESLMKSLLFKTKLKSKKTITVFDVA